MGAHFDELELVEVRLNWSVHVIELIDILILEI